MSKLKYGEFSFPAPTARPSVGGYARGGSTSNAPKTKGQAKVAKVMGEFKRGDLHSGSAKGPVVKSPKQAMAIALSEKKAAGYKDGGDAKKGEKSAKLVGMKREPEAIVKKEVALLKKAGAPAKIIKHEERELAMKKGGKACYADGGDVKQMVKENVRAKNVKPVRGGSGQMTDRERMMAERGRNSGQLTDRERMMMEQARGEKMDRQMRDAERQHYERERAENEADRRAMGDALMYIPRKIGEGARSAYDYVMGKKEGGEVHSDVAMDKKMIKKAVHKHEAAMHPGKPMTKLKKGGDVQKYADGGMTSYMAAPGTPGGMPTRSAPNAPSQLSEVARNFAAQRNASPAAGRMGVIAPQAPAVAPGRNMGQAPAYTGARPMGNAPMAPSPLAGIARSFAGTRQPGAMKKGGSVKKGVPVHNRNPKC